MPRKKTDKEKQREEDDAKRLELERWEKEQAEERKTSLNEFKHAPRVELSLLTAFGMSDIHHTSHLSEEFKNTVSFEVLKLPYSRSGSNPVKIAYPVGK